MKTILTVSLIILLTQVLNSQNYIQLKDGSTIENDSIYRIHENHVEYLKNGNLHDLPKKNISKIINKEGTWIFDTLGNVIICPEDTIQQSPDKPGSNLNLWWVNSGMGSISGGYGTAYNFNFSMHSNNNLYSMRYTSNIVILWGNDITEFGLLYGRSATSKTGQASVSAGIGIVRGEKNGEFLGNTGGWFSFDRYETLTYYTVGIPLQTQLFINLCPYVALGVTLYANVNPEQNLGGGLICLRFGKLR